MCQLFSNARAAIINRLTYKSKIAQAQSSGIPPTRTGAEPDIKVGDMIISNGKYPNLSEVFYKPRKVIRIEPTPNYAPVNGGSFVYVMVKGKEQGFYLNGIKKQPL